MMLQQEDDDLIVELKAQLGLRSKVDVVRKALALLADQAERAAKEERWREVSRRVAKSSARVNKAFRTASRLKRVP